MADAFENLLVRVGAETQQFFSGMRQVVSTTAQVAGQVARFGAVAGAALAGVGIVVTKMAMDFQDQMADVDTLLGQDTPVALQDLSKEVKRVAILTGKDLSDIASGMYETVSAFGAGAENAKQLEIAAKAAKGGSAATLDSIKLLSSWTKGFGDTSAAAVQKAADLAFQTVKLGQTTFPEMAANMGKAIPLAATLSVKQEALAGAMATLTGVTGNTAEVSTQLRAVFQALINPTSQMATKLSKLGFSSGKTMIEALGLQGTLDLLARSTGGNTSELAKMFGSVEALNAVLALVGAQSADFTAKTKAMTEAAGAADSAFEKKKNTVAGMLASLKQTATVIAVDFGEKALPSLQSFLTWVQDNMPTIQSGIETAMTAIGKAINAFKENVWDPFVTGFTTGMEGNEGSIAGFAQTVGAKLGEIAQFFADTKNWWDPFVEGWKTGNTEMETSTKTAFASIGSILRSIVGTVGDILGLLEFAWTDHGSFLGVWVQETFGGMLGFLDGIFQAIFGMVKLFAGALTLNWQLAMDGLREMWEGTWKAIKGFFLTIWAPIDALMTQALGETWAKWKQGGADWVQGLLDGVMGMLPQIAPTLEGLWESFSTWFVELATGAYDWGVNVMVGFYDGIVSKFNEIRESVKNFVQDMIDQTKGLLGIHSPSRVFADIGANIGAGLARGIESTSAMVDRAMGSITPAAGISAGAATSGSSGTDEFVIPITLTLDGQVLTTTVVRRMPGVLRQPVRALGNP